MGAGDAPVFGVPESTPASRPFSLTIRLKTSATERTPWAGFQSYLPDITRASPVNLSESVPASFAKAACNPAGCDCARANGTIRATASAHTAYLNQNPRHVELLCVTKGLVLRVTPNAGLNAAFFYLSCVLAMRLLAGQYAAKNQCSQEK